MARADAGLTISELAKRAGVSRDTLSKAERGQHSLQASTLSKIAGALGKRPSELLAEEERLASVPMPRPASELPSRLRWALEVPKQELEAFAADANREELEELQQLLRERWDEYHLAWAFTIDRDEQRPRFKYPMPKEERSRLRAERGEVYERRQIVLQEIRRREPPPVATITTFAPRHNRRPLVRWLIPEKERAEWREKLKADFPEGFDEAEADEAEGQAEVEAVKVLAGAGLE